MVLVVWWLWWFECRFRRYFGSFFGGGGQRRARTGPQRARSFNGSKYHFHGSNPRKDAKINYDAPCGTCNGTGGKNPNDVQHVQDVMVVDNNKLTHHLPWYKQSLVRCGGTEKLLKTNVMIVMVKVCK